MNGNKSFLVFFSVFLLSTLVVDVLSQSSLQIEEVRGFRFAQSNKLTKSSINPKFRLPEAVIPEHYVLTITPLLDQDEPPWGNRFTAPGSVRIRVLCQQATNQISLHQHPTLEIIEASVVVTQVSTGNSVPIEGFGYEEERQFYNITLRNGLVANERYDISMNFIAPVADSTAGLYRASYLTPDGETKWMATTQFESPFARQAFPCFDEPDKKATFDISIGRTTNRNSLSNSEQIATGVQDPNLPPGYVWDRYNTTVKMSSYLIAMIVSEFACEKATEGIFNKPVQVCGPPHLILPPMSGGVFAADQSAKILRFLQTTFDFDYEM